MTGESESTKMVWVLSYMQEGVIETWKDNLLDELSKGESEIETVEKFRDKTVEKLVKKMRNKFGEIAEEKRKVEQLRIIEQGRKMYNKYIQEFKKIMRGSGYKEQSLIEEFKRELNGKIRRKLAEAKSLPCMIEEWQERVVRLDRNQRQSRAEERMLGKNIACLLENIQQREEFGRGLYRGRGDQITQRTGGQNFRGRAQNNQGGQREQGLGRYPNTIDIDRERKGDKIYFVCGKQGHMAKNCWQRKEREERVAKMLQELAKENEGQ